MRASQLRQFLQFHIDGMKDIIDAMDSGADLEHVTRAATVTLSRTQALVSTFDVEELTATDTTKETRQAALGVTAKDFLPDPRPKSVKEDEVAS